MPVMRGAKSSGNTRIDEIGQRSSADIRIETVKVETGSSACQFAY